MNKRKSKPFGFALLEKQVLDHVQGELCLLVNECEGDSEIELLLATAIISYQQFIGSEYTHILRPNSPEMEERILRDTHEPDLSLIFRQQAQIGSYRVDFLIHALDCKKYSDGERVWRKLVVECDGHNFHERTKEQAARDRSRDRDLVCKGYEVFRFTGSELWRDPIGCAEQIYNWAIKGWY